MACLSTFFKKCFVLTSISLLVGCTNLSLVPISFHIKAKNNLNTDQYRQSLPVQLRIYQLKELSSFKEATFKQLWKQDKQILADSLVSVKELTVMPSSKLKLKIERAPATKYIGVIALFRESYRAHWRAYQPVHSQVSALMTSMHLSLSSSSVRFSNGN